MIIERYLGAGRKSWENEILDILPGMFGYGQENITSSTIAGIAVSIHMFRSAFSHYIKKRIGMTISQWINVFWVKHAGKVHPETDRNIISVCFKTRFINISYFNR